MCAFTVSIHEDNKKSVNRDLEPSLIETLSPDSEVRENVSNISVQPPLFPSLMLKFDTETVEPCAWVGTGGVIEEGTHLQIRLGPEISSCIRQGNHVLVKISVTTRSNKEAHEYVSPRLSLSIMSDPESGCLNPLTILMSRLIRELFERLRLIRRRSCISSVQGIVRLAAPGLGIIDGFLGAWRTVSSTVDEVGDRITGIIPNPGAWVARKIFTNKEHIPSGEARTDVAPRDVYVGSRFVGGDGLRDLLGLTNAPKWSLHWGVIVGSYCHQLTGVPEPAISVGGFNVYNAYENEDDLSTYARDHAGVTTWNDQAIRQAG